MPAELLRYRVTKKSLFLDETLLCVAYNIVAETTREKQKQKQNLGQMIGKNSVIFLRRLLSVRAAVNTINNYIIVCSVKRVGRRKVKKKKKIIFFF